MDKRYCVNIPAHWEKIKCPFFKSDNYNSISCEGCSEESYIRHTFKNRFIKDEWQKEYCTEIDFFKNCPLYSLANEKYS